jgi:anti-sigma B factor antagonist
MAEQGFSLGVEQVAGGTVVRVAGELDLVTSLQLDECLKNLNGVPITVDLSAVTFMDSCGMAAISAAMKHADQHGSTFALRGVQPFQRRLLEIVGLAEQLDLDG